MDPEAASDDDGSWKEECEGAGRSATGASEDVGSRKKQRAAKRAEILSGRRKGVPPNKPCPCGSKKKYKRCCAVADVAGRDTESRGKELTHDAAAAVIMQTSTLHI